MLYCLVTVSQSGSVSVVSQWGREATLLHVTTD